MKLFAALTADELGILAKLTSTHPIFRVYLSDGVAATQDGATNRTALVGRCGTGAALGIVFERTEVRTIIGRLSETEEWVVADLPQGGELHSDQAAARRIKYRLGRRVIGAHELRYYALDRRPPRAPDARCIRLGSDHLKMLTDFFASHYPHTIFSPWRMLERLFLGIVENGKLAACGGVVAAGDGIANVGNFLTAPNARGRGQCRAIAATLAHQLFDQGISQVTLGTTKDNTAACRAYEAIGFRCFDRQMQLDLA